MMPDFNLICRHVATLNKLAGASFLRYVLRWKQKEALPERPFGRLAALAFEAHMRRFTQQTWWSRWTAILLLLLFWWRLLDTVARKSVTFDEIIHILHGVLYWQRWELFSVVQNPPLINALIGLPVSFLFHPELPTTHPAWGSMDWLTLSKAFMWDFNSNGLALIWTGRWIIMLLALLLAALVFRWSGQLFGFAGAGLASLILVTFDPNVLAHGLLATTDLGTAFFFVLAAYLVWRYWARGSGHTSLYLATAVAIGGVLAAKFSGIIFIIGLVVLWGWRWLVERPSARTAARWLAQVAGWIGIAITLFLLLYRFQMPPLLDDWLIQQAHQLTGHDAFFMGEVSRDGWLAYFPVVFLIKTPIPTLMLMTFSAVLFFWRRQWRRWAVVWPWLLAAGVAAAGLTSRVNIGYRYLLPLLPLVYVTCGQLAGLAQSSAHSKWTRWVIVGLFSGLGLVSLMAHPHYLAYFNQIAGGSDNGWRWVVDSNIDWGQDLVALAAYAEEHPEPIQAAWLGTAPPSAYGIANITPMPVWPWGHEDPAFDPFYPPQPAAGVYVISATQLQGVYLKDRARFAWFKQREPDEKLGYSLFVYRVPAQGAPTGVAVSGVALADVLPADMASINSNDFRARWFDARGSLLWPGGGEIATFAAIGAGHQPQDTLLTNLYALPGINESRAGSGAVERRYTWVHWLASPITAVWQSGRPDVVTQLGWSPDPVVGAANWQTVQPLTTAVYGGKLQLLGVQAAPAAPRQPLRLLTLWRVAEKTERPLKIFVHLLDEAGQIGAQHDGLDVRTVGLRRGDEFAQLHTLALPDGAAAGPIRLQIGVYDAETGARLSLDNVNTDRVLLQLPANSLD